MRHVWYWGLRGLGVCIWGAWRTWYALLSIIVSLDFYYYWQIDVWKYTKGCGRGEQRSFHATTNDLSFPMVLVACSEAIRQVEERGTNMSFSKLRCFQKDWKLEYCFCEPTCRTTSRRQLKNQRTTCTSQFVFSNFGCGDTLAWIRRPKCLRPMKWCGSRVHQLLCAMRVVQAVSTLQQCRAFLFALSFARVIPTLRPTGTDSRSNRTVHLTCDRKKSEGQDR